ncbi:MAG: RsiV family protein [bacterium]
MKKHLPSFIVVIVVCLIVIIVPSVIRYNHNRLNTLTQVDADLNVKIHTIDEMGKEYTAHAEYPLLTDDETWNTQINQFVISAISDFKKEVHDNNESRKATAGPNEKVTPVIGDMTIRFQVGQMNPTAVSVVLFIDYYAGGANGNSTIKTFNYNPQTKTFLTLNDIKGKLSLDDIAKNVREELKSQFSDENVASMIDEGTASKVENFQNVIFDANTMTFYFEKYAVLPGVYGTQTVSIPRLLVQN